MTTPRSSAPLSTGRGANATQVEASDSVAAVAQWHSPISRRDAITLSTGALALIRAGLAVRAYIMVAWESVRQVATLAGGRIVVFENGIYR